MHGDCLLTAVVSGQSCLFFFCFVPFGLYCLFCLHVLIFVFYLALWLNVILNVVVTSKLQNALSLSCVFDIAAPLS